MANKRVEEQITNDLGCIHRGKPRVSPTAFLLHLQPVDCTVKGIKGTLKNVLLNQELEIICINMNVYCFEGDVGIKYLIR
jgi:hypothetical protein